MLHIPLLKKLVIPYLDRLSPPPEETIGSGSVLSVNTIVAEKGRQRSRGKNTDYERVFPYFKLMFPEYRQGETKNVSFWVPAAHL